MNDISRWLIYFNASQPIYYIIIFMFYNIRPSYDALKSININIVIIMVNLFISMHYVVTDLSYYGNCL